MTSSPKWRSRAERFLSRRFNPEADPVLRALAERAVTFAANGHLVRCNRCGGNGPVNLVVVLFANPAARDMDSAQAWCRGCARDEGRTDYLVASSVPVKRAASPIAVIEC